MSRSSIRRRALVVDDEPSSRLNIRDLLSMERFAVDEAGDGLDGLEMVKRNSYDVVLLDIRMPKMDGLTTLKNIKLLQPMLPVIVFTAFGSSDRAIEAMKSGAFDYLTKPFDIDELVEVIRRAVEHKSLATEVQVLRQRLADVDAGEYQPDQFVSKSPSMQKIFKMIGKVAPSDVTVLIEGETGTGKELVANAIEYHSRRREKPFVKVNCSAIPEGLLESELFGHEKGAFTGAHQQRQGRFELADGGTLFLDEIGELSPALQPKILRVLEQGEFQRVGGKETLRVDVRVLAATNRNLQEEVQAGRFRKDLFFRLQVVHIVIPPLRERREDIPALVSHLLKKHGGKRDLLASRQVLSLLKAYAWPGNVRELENVIERAVVLTPGRTITEEHISLPVVSTVDRAKYDRAAEASSLALRDILEKVERDVILAALERARWNKTRAAKLLKISRRVLFTKIKEYKLTP
ncbi:MAG: sigma-54 dependent transcriptional regulator [Bacteroidota bacterium]